MLRGVERLRPSKPDVRAALLLLHLPFPRNFKVPLNKNQLWVKAVTVLGFLGMFRFHTYARLTTKNVVVVRKDGRETNLMSGPAAEVRGHFDTEKALGFYFKFHDKIHPNSRAYYSRLMDLQEPWRSLCPVKLLTE